MQAGMDFLQRVISTTASHLAELPIIHLKDTFDGYQNWTQNDF